MEEGSFRCDANVSIRPPGQTELGTRTELKNLNSFRFVEQAIIYEIMRQSEVLTAGQVVLQETRLWDSKARKSRVMRTKEDAHDYRYFPEPDLPELCLDAAWIENIRQAMPMLPRAQRQELEQNYGLSAEQARILCAEPQRLDFFHAALHVCPNASLVAKWIINELLGELDNMAWASLPFDGAAFGKLLTLMVQGNISNKIAKIVLLEMMQHGGSPQEIVAARGLEQMSDPEQLQSVIEAVLHDNPDKVQAYRAGKQQLYRFFVGQVMQRTQGKANPKMIDDALKRLL